MRIQVWLPYMSLCQVMRLPSSWGVREARLRRLGVLEMEKVVRE